MDVVHDDQGLTMINLEEEARKRRERLLNKNSGASTEEKRKEDQEKQHETTEVKPTTRSSQNDTFEAPEGLLDAEGAEILAMDNQYD